jgi:23S rRNA (guanosine2251-2'-O)-methyltransferase
MTEKNVNWIWGYHSVEACLENFPELIQEILVETNEGDKPISKQQNRSAESSATSGLDQNFEKLVQNNGLKINRVKSLPRIFTEKRTQGVVAKISEFPEKTFSEIEEDFLNSENTGQWVLLDGIQDPRNFGAIIRSAAAFHVRGVFYPLRNQTKPSGLVAQASAGNIFRVPLIACPTFHPIWKVLPEAPVRMLALDADGLPIQQVVPSAREQLSVLWVLGSEGEGIRPQIREKCHAVAMIPIREDVESLNASVAASLAFYIAARKLDSEKSSEKV